MICEPYSIEDVTEDIEELDFNLLAADADPDNEVPIATPDLDQYFTSDALAERLSQTVFALIEDAGDSIDLFVDPAVGYGAFFTCFPHDKRFGYDIEPQVEGDCQVQQQDFLTVPFPPASPDQVVYLTNPPFGKNGSMAIAFFNHCAKDPRAKYIAFIFPRGLINATQAWGRLDPYFSLIYKEDLGDTDFTEYCDNIRTVKKVPTCFLVFRRTIFPRRKPAVPDYAHFEIIATGGYAETVKTWIEPQIFRDYLLPHAKRKDGDRTGEFLRYFFYSRAGASAGRVQVGELGIAKATEYSINPHTGIGDLKVTQGWYLLREKYSGVYRAIVDLQQVLARKYAKKSTGQNSVSLTETDSELAHYAFE